MSKALVSCCSGARLKRSGASHSASLDPGYRCRGAARASPAVDADRGAATRLCLLSAGNPGASLRFAPGYSSCAAPRRFFGWNNRTGEKGAPVSPAVAAEVPPWWANLDQPAATGRPPDALLGPSGIARLVNSVRASIIPWAGTHSRGKPCPRVAMNYRRSL
jgi:hypothetical protein